MVRYIAHKIHMVKPKHRYCSDIQLEAFRELCSKDKYVEKQDDKQKEMIHKRTEIICINMGRVVIKSTDIIYHAQGGSKGNHGGQYRAESAIKEMECDV